MRYHFIEKAFKIIDWGFLKERKAVARKFDKQKYREQHLKAISLKYFSCIALQTPTLDLSSHSFDVNNGV
jgi:hypothetical protein